VSSLASSLPQHLARLGVEQVEVVFTERAPSFRGSSVSEEASRITGAARGRHLRDGYGFWEHVVSLAADASADTRRQLFAAAARSAGNPETTAAMSVDEFAEHLTGARWRGLPGRQLVSLSSRVRVNGQACHLQLLDLGLAQRPGSADAVRAALDVLGLHGLLVASGKSYHFYGTFIDAWDAYVDLLARASLLSPLVDSRWALRQIRAGRGVLRVSTNIERDTYPPSPIE
jgi:hypothetical protein